MKHFDVIECKDESAWLETRRLGLGASESAALFGVTAWDSPYSLWAGKLGLLEGKPKNEAMRWGTKLESLIADEYAESTGHALKDFGRYSIMRSSQTPILFATLDRVIESAPGHDGPGVLEIKAVGAHREDEWAEEPPLRYQVQLQHQLAVTGYSWGVLAVLFGGQKFGFIEQPRNDKFIGALAKKAKDFWRHVESGEPPSVDGAKQTEEALKYLHPNDSGATVELPPEAADWDAQLEQIDADLKALEMRKREVRNQLIAAIGDASFARLPNGVRYSYKTTTRKGHEVKESTFRALRRLAAKESV